MYSQPAEQMHQCGLQENEIRYTDKRQDAKGPRQCLTYASPVYKQYIPKLSHIIYLKYLSCKRALACALSHNPRGHMLVRHPAYSPI